MDAKKIRTSLSRFAGWLGLTICSLIIKVIPGKLLYSFARGIAGIAYLFAGKQRRIASESLTIAFQQTKSQEELKQIARDCFTFMATWALELMFLMDRPKELMRCVNLKGQEYLDQALAKKHGVILVSGHLGNFPLMMARLSLGGYPINGIMRQMRDTRVEKIFLEKRNRLGVKTIYSQPRKVCVDNSIRALRNNELLFLPIDQNFGTAGVFVEFFGKKAATATGPVVLAQRTKAALIPCFIINNPDATHTIFFEPELKLQQGSTDDETIVMNIQRLTTIIEQYIRRFPAQWGWIHRRWKSRPTEKNT
ncbi:MAG: lysophospholipid acyltransferase family protein [Candidatus Omnitrophica bacterium]|nr:lysophospholipid acyltransferase family protein [Candidatus Omnitrophota bacterium]